MKEKPILFSGAMVRAILTGTKTQTRRLLTLPKGAELDGITKKECPPILVFCSRPGQPTGSIHFGCPYGAPGDRLWVRETWMGWKLISSERDEWEALTAEVRGKPHREHFIENGHPDSIEYRATSDSCGPWNPAIHMLREYSRITLEITDVRVERLKTISEADARAEGVTLDGPRRICPCETLVEDPGPHIASCPNTDIDFERTGSPILDAFSSLWNSINAKRAPWSSNPWVWAVSFKRVTS